MLEATDEMSINGHDVLAFAGKSERGPMLLSTVDGRLPTGNEGIALGITTLHQVGAHVGSVVQVTVQLPTGGSRTVPFRVVGTASFPRAAGGGRTLCTEVMIGTPGIRNHIRTNDMHKIYSEVQSGQKYGMETMDHSLLRLYQEGEITYDMAVSMATYPESIKDRLA